MGNTATSSHRTTPPGLGRLRQFAHLGGQDVPLSMADLQQIRHEANLCPTKPSLRVLGFRPSHTRLHYHSMDAAYLIYPNDTLVKGSAQAFSELHSAMLRKQVVGIGEVLHRLHWSSRLVALIPLPTSSSTPGASVQDEKDEKENERLLTTPPGMMVVTLPFEDDIRTLEEDEAYTEWMRRQVGEAPNDNVKPEIEPSNAMISPLSIQLASEDLLQATTRLIQRHGLVDTCLGEDFENAALTEFFTYLEEVALELPHDETESPTFDTRPNEELLAEALGDCIDKFRQALPEDIEIPKTKSGGGTKRKAAKDLPPDDSGMDWQDLYESDELNTVKVPHLKAYLRSVGAPLSGSKAVLVDRVADLLKQSMAATSKKSGSGDPKVKLEV